MKKIILACLVLIIAALPMKALAQRPDADAVWSLNRYLTWYTLGANYPSSGVPAGTITVIESDGIRSVRMSNRTSDIQGVDLRFGSPIMHSGIVLEGNYVFVAGRVEEPQADSRLRLSNLNGAVNLAEFDIQDDGTFEAVYQLTEQDIEGLNGFRVNTTGLEAFYLDVFEIIAGRYFADVPNWDLASPSLAEAFSEYFLMGNIWSNRGQMSDHATYDMFLHHYNAVTASNHHKVSFLLGSTPNAWDFDFVLADAIVDWAEENRLALTGHTLVWHTQSQAWLTNTPGTLEPLTRAEAMANMHKYISTVAARYSGRMYSWDVVNEAIVPRGSWSNNPNWRHHMRQAGYGIAAEQTGASRWYAAFANGAVGDECGSDYVFYAFKFARMYDPHAILYYNDYGTTWATKRDAIAQMVEEINERWRNHELYDGRLLIERIGMQGHYELGAPNNNILRNAIERYIQTGAQVSFTELNMYITGSGIDPTDEDALPALFERQSIRLYNILSMVLEFSNYMPRVTFFIWVDLPAEQGAWRRWPYSQLPSLFDLDRQNKPAFYSVLRAAQDAAPANISVPQVMARHIPLAKEGENFSVKLSAQQTNHAPILWDVVYGNLPPGLRIIPATGVILGTPEQEGAFTFTVEARNALGAGTMEFTMAVGEEFYTPYVPEIEEIEIIETTEEAEAAPPETPYEPTEDIDQPRPNYALFIILAIVLIGLIIFIVTKPYISGYIKRKR